VRRTLLKRYAAKNGQRGVVGELLVLILVSLTCIGGALRAESIVTHPYLGVWNALNLDGGGSTSRAMEDPVTHVPFLANVSSDNPGGRAVGSSLAVFARPNGG
jgi:hypothetical protein